MIPLHIIGPYWATRVVPPVSAFAYYDSFTDAQWGETASDWQHRRDNVTRDLDATNNVADPGENVTTVELLPRLDADRVALASGSPPQAGQLWRLDLLAYDEPSEALPIGQRGLTGQIMFPVQVRHLTNPLSFSGYLYSVGFMGLVDNGATCTIGNNGNPIQEYSYGTLAVDDGPREGTLLTLEVNCDGSTLECYVWARGWAYDGDSNPIDTRPSFTQYQTAEKTFNQTEGAAEMFSLDFTDGFDTVVINVVTTIDTATGEFKAYIRPINGQPDVEVWPALGTGPEIAGVQNVIDNYFEVGLKQRGHVRSYESPASNDYTDNSVPYIKLLPPD